MNDRESIADNKEERLVHTKKKLLVNGGYYSVLCSIQRDGNKGHVDTGQRQRHLVP